MLLSLPAFLSLSLCTHTHTHTEHPPENSSPFKHSLAHAITSSQPLSVHTRLASLFSESLWFRTLLFHWLNKAINSFQIQQPVWSGAMEHEQRHLKRFPANTLLPWVPKKSYYYFQPFALGDFSPCWGERALSPTRTQGHQDTLRSQGRNVSMVPSSRSSGQQYKISPPGTQPPLTLCLRVPFCHFTIALSHHCPPPTHSEEWGWLDGFCSVFSVGILQSGRVGTCRGKRRGLVVAEVDRVVWSLKESGAAWQWWLCGSPRFGLMAPLGPTYCCWSDGLLQYEATRPGARFHIHFSLSLSKTLNDFPKIGKREFNRGGAECAVEGKRVK